MRVLLTGIGGSIGIHMFSQLMANTDWEVVGIDSFRHKGLTDRVAYTLQRNPDWQRRLTLVTHDLTAPLSYMSRRALGSVDGILNFASITDVADSIGAPGHTFYNNDVLMMNLMQMWKDQWSYSAKFFLHVSSDEVYGPVRTVGEVHKEWAPIVPSSPYAASKAVQEAIAISYWRTYKLPLIIVNIANNFGPMQNPAKFPCLAQRLIQAGKPVPIHVHDAGALRADKPEMGTRYYLHSWNTANAILHILDTTQPYPHRDGDADRPDRFNITDIVCLSNMQLAKGIADILNRKLEVKYENVHKLRPGHDLHYGLNGGKLKAAGWVPPMDFWKSMEASIKWYKDNPRWLNPR